MPELTVGNVAGNFNPRAREGRDVIWIRKARRRQHFNPRAREGRDRFRYSGFRILEHFNPRAREGRDERET